MGIAKRIFFFLAVNFLVMLSVMFVYSILMVFVLPPEFTQSAYGPIALISLLFGFGGAFISLWISKFYIKRSLRLQMISDKETSSEYRWIRDTTHKLARKAGLTKMPEVGVYQSPELNAFATGPSRNNSLVAVSSGLLTRMNENEIEGVLGHEVAHIANGDMVTMTLVQGVVNAVVVFLSHIVMSIVENAFRDEHGRGGLGFFMHMIIFNLIYNMLAFAAMPLVAFVSRWREYRADAGGAMLAGREKMIGGLKVLQSHIERLETSHHSLSTLKISGKAPSSLLRFWSTHPPIADRIRRLERGGHYRTGF